MADSPTSADQINAAHPPVECPHAQPEKWWGQWVHWLREYGRRWSYHNDTDGPSSYYAEYLFFGIATFMRMEYRRRAVHEKVVTGEMEEDGKKINLYDEIPYNVWDVRDFYESKPRPLYLHQDLLQEHCYIMGPSGSGKTSLGIMPILIQLIRGHKLPSGEQSPKRPIVVFDLKGDPALFHTVRLEAKARGQKFLFFTPEKNAPTYRFNPFKGFDRTSSSVAQLCQLILDALGLNHGKGYGRGYYTQRSRQALHAALRDFPNVSSFRDLLNFALPQSLDERSKKDKRARVDAFELASVIETLEEYDQLITLPDEEDAENPGVIHMPRVVRDCEVVYFWLPAALESISVGEIAKLALFNLRLAAQDWKRHHTAGEDERKITLVIDEFQHIAGENLRGVLQDARSFGIGAILANQGLHDLKAPSGFDLGPAVMANTRTKMFFTTASEQECYVYVERGKGFTDARPYPKPGNPWLNDLAPEDFAYRTRLTWPIDKPEYNYREATPLPKWWDIPGEDAWVKKVQERRSARKVKDALPRGSTKPFVPKDDAKAADQKKLLKNLADELSAQ